MRRNWFWSLSSCLLLAPLAWGATILERQEVHTFLDDGTVEIRFEQVVELERNQDIEDYSVHYVFLDDNIELDEIALRAVKPDGKTVKAKKRHQDQMEFAASGVTHDSSKIHAVALPKSIPVGSKVYASHTKIVKPYFPSRGLRLTFRDDVAKFRLEVNGAPAGFRWKSFGDWGAFQVKETESGLLVTGSQVATRDAVDWAGEDAPWVPELRYAWGDYQDWAGVGRWYESLIDPVIRDAESVTTQAKELITDLDGPQAILDTLLDFAQRQVRYVAVEVGIGGYRPSHPAATLDRRWGDCKDKSFLLIDMLNEAGIAAHPVLILSSWSDLIDPEFPDATWFNHAIVAVEQQPWMPADWPIAGGYLFIDPTQTRGGAGWLGLGKQGQHALVVRGEASELIRTPVMPALESRDLKVKLEIDDRGDASGTATYAMTGSTASYYLAQVAEEPRETMEQHVRDLLSDLMPGGELSLVTWEGEDGEIPEMTFTANVALPDMLQGAADRRSFRVEGFQRCPSPKALTDRTTPVVVRPIIDRSVWEIGLPTESCTVKDKVSDVDNSVGRFHQTIAGAPGQVTITRELDMRQRQVEVESIEELKELAVAESRAAKRRVRLACGSGDS